jgi:hypothetical protein
MRGNLLSFEKKKEEKIGTWNLGGSSVLAGNERSTISWTGMHINKHGNQQELYILKLIQLRTGSAPGFASFSRY